MDQTNQQEVLINQRNEKQTFLREQIADHQLDPEKFKTFCLEQDEEGGNIDHWTLEQLQQLVWTFNQQNQQQHRSSEVNVERRKESITQKEFQIFEQCKQLDHTAISEALSTSIRITSYCIIVQNSRRLVKGGFFKQSYVEYELVTDELNWTVIRRYSDFDVLNQTLSKLFPGLALPALPKKHWQRNLEEYYLIKRQYHLQKYINQIANHPLISRAPCVIDFLKISDHDQWQTARQEMSRTQKVADVTNTYSLDGQQKLSIKVEQEMYLRQFNQYLYKSGPVFKRLQSHSKQLYLALDSVSSILREMEQEFNILYNMSNEFENGSRNDQTQLYQILKNQHIKWAEEVESQMQLIQQQYMFFYGHVKNNNLKLQQHFNDKFNLGQQLRNKQNRVLKMKEKLYEQGYSYKWQVDQSLENLDEIKRNKEMAMEHMLPQVIDIVFDDRRHSRSRI